MINQAYLSPIIKNKENTLQFKISESLYIIFSNIDPQTKTQLREKQDIKTACCVCPTHKEKNENAQWYTAYKSLDGRFFINQELEIYHISKLSHTYCPKCYIKEKQKISKN